MMANGRAAPAGGVIKAGCCDVTAVGHPSAAITRRRERERKKKKKKKKKKGKRT